MGTLVTHDHKYRINSLRLCPSFRLIAIIPHSHDLVFLPNIYILLPTTEACWVRIWVFKFRKESSLGLKYSSYQHQPMEDSTFQWRIENFSKLTAEKEMLKSDTFLLYGHGWNISLHPKSSEGSQLGLFLSVADTNSLPTGCNIVADFCIAVVNQWNSTETLRKCTKAACFDSQATKRGWDEFAPWSKRCDRDGFLVDDALIVEAQVTVKPNLSSARNPVQEFADLFAEIQKGTAASSSSSAVSSQRTRSSPQALDIFYPPSLLKRETDHRPCSGIHPGLFPKLCSAFGHFPLPKSAPQAQSSGLVDFCSQFNELSQPIAANLAVLDAMQLFFESKDDTCSSLKRMDNARMKMKKAMDEVSKEIKELEGQLWKLKDAESRLFEGYTAIGNKSERLKKEWDEIAAKNEDMAKQKEKAEKEIAKIVAKWNDLVSAL